MAASANLNFAHTFAVRMRLCHGIAMALRKIANDGLPPELAVSLVFPLLKALKPGQVADRADPTAYRTLAVAGLLSKILALLMLTRLTHFAEGTGALPWEQGSSRSGGQSAEQHALTLLSFLRARRRAGKWSYVLYVDVVKAFDRVHPAALDAVLLRMGVPAPMRELLRVWRAGRLGAVVVNGVQSAPFPIGSGVPQGCPLSPLLFNLFLSSLSSFLASCPELRGAEALSVRLFRLIFADDVAIIAEEPAELQAALSRIHAWMRAWGLDISVGPSKTEAQAFPPSPAAAALAAPLPALFALDGRAVVWVQLYRYYLGLSISSDLTDTVQASRAVNAVRTAYARCFHRNEVVRTLPPGVQLQVLRTYVLSASEYLSGVLTVRASVAAALDAVALDAVRGIFGLPRHTSTALLWGIWPGSLGHAGSARAAAHAVPAPGHHHRLAGVAHGARAGRRTARAAVARGPSPELGARGLAAACALGRARRRRTRRWPAGRARRPRCAGCRRHRAPGGTVRDRPARPPPRHRPRVRGGGAGVR